MSDTLLIGDARLDRIVDIPRYGIALSWLLPDATPTAIAAERDWLTPRFLDGDDLILSIHSVVLRVADKVVLIDTCIGEDKPRPNRPPWNARVDTSYLPQLAALGLGVEDVDYVLCTHLHADHVGWNTRLVNGRWVPTFPNATYLIGRTELAYWDAQVQSGNAAVNHGSYIDSVLPILEAKRARLVDTDDEILQGCVIRSLAGHTPGQVGLSLRRGGEQALFTGDAIHHPVQVLHPAWSTSLCADRDMARVTRLAILDESAACESWIIPMHFADTCGCKIKRKGESYAFTCL